MTRDAGSGILLLALAFGAGVAFAVTLFVTWMSR